MSTGFLRFCTFGVTKGPVHYSVPMVPLTIYSLSNGHGKRCQVQEMQKAANCDIV